MNPDATEADRLRRENEELRRQLAQANGVSHGAATPEMWRPSGITMAAIFLFLIVLTVIAFFAGYTPLQKRQTLIAAEATEQEHALPRVEVIEVGRTAGRSELELPGSIQAITEAPILSRSDGYVLKRLVDIGDQVKTGQPLAEIDAPEMDEQIRQARATLRQAQVSVDQALGKSREGQGGHRAGPRHRAALRHSLRAGDHLAPGTRSLPVAISITHRGRVGAR